jgi:hypothetical protein
MNSDPGMRSVRLVKMKRKRIRIEKLLPLRFDYGHWWFELGDPLDTGSESYGWWPRALPQKAFWKAIATLLGTDGELNAQGDGSGTARRDPYHGDEAADVQFHPVVADSDPRSDEEIADCLRRFASSFRGRWRWTFGFGQNCRSFQRAAMRHCGLRGP